MFNCLRGDVQGRRERARESPPLLLRLSFRSSRWKHFTVGFFNANHPHLLLLLLFLPSPFFVRHLQSICIALVVVFDRLWTMHSMVGSFAPYTRKQQQSGIVRGYCYRFTQCSFPCGVTMLIVSLLLIILGTSLLIYLFHYNGCSTIGAASRDGEGVDIISISSSSVKCNRQAMKVLGITFVVSGAVLFGISLVVIKYSRGSEENNVIRATKSSLRANATRHHSQRSSSEHEPNQMIVSIK